MSKENNPLPKDTLVMKAMILDAIDERIDLKRVENVDDMISIGLYAILEMYYREQGNDGIYTISEMWKKIKLESID